MSGKSKEEVAFELLAKLKGVGIWGENNIEAILDMYTQCLESTSGLRVLDGKIPVAQRLQEQDAAPTNAAPVTAQVPAPAQRQAAPAPAQRQAAPAPAPRQAAPAQPVVRQQQEQLQQAFQQQQVPQAR